MKTHTPGPWAFKPSNHLQEFTGFVLAGNRAIAAIEHTGQRGVLNEQDRANAALVAAAPELLAHLRVLSAEDSQCELDWVKKKEAARAAINPAARRTTQNQNENANV